MSTLRGVESPDSYDFWTAAWLVSNAISGLVNIPRPHAPVHMNLYCVLCAEAGITRKSTSVRTASVLLDKWRARHNIPMHLQTEAFSATDLRTRMALLREGYSFSHVAIASSELVTILGKGRGSAKLPGLLTDVYDCGNREYITLVGASTPSWLLRTMNPDVVEGGFTSRCLFIIEDRPKRLVAWPQEDIDAARVSELVDGLNAIRSGAIDCFKREGGIRITPTARELFASWYEGRKPVSDAFGASFQAREDHHILRLSGLMCASDGTWEINQGHLKKAIEVINYTRQTSTYLFGVGIAASKTYALVDKMRTILVGAGRIGISQTNLTSRCGRQGSAEDQKLVLNVMHEMNLIQKFLIESGAPGRDTTMYRATKSLAHSGAIDQVLEQIIPQEVI